MLFRLPGPDCGAGISETARLLRLSEEIWLVGSPQCPANGRLADFPGCSVLAGMQDDRITPFRVKFRVPDKGGTPLHATLPAVYRLCDNDGMKQGQRLLGRQEPFPHNLRR